MKTLKDLIEDLNDESLLKEFSDEVLKLSEEKKIEPKDAFIALAKEKGYEISPEEIEELVKQKEELMSEDELGKVSGGITPTTLTVALFVTAFGGATAAGTYVLTQQLDP